ncbi:hypothetical protein LZ198_09620 [Myxococcus sp. K15C18031901]|uniref:hypothetical protein n=1 Tax=Myxococcus dinghuensis TaxID=2906761 RepID=UPI0020A7BDEC|nr:hypothetical protein [Myxococcus dinghuensis]MCP3099126.1 hypothetical protein [Myxococcus dinghuensis]
MGLLGGCEPLDDGGGGGGGTVAFTRGFAFVRESDRNVYVVDDAGDPNSPQRLTSVGGVYTPAVSRDGRSIVFVQRAGASTALRTVPSTGGAVATLLSANDPVCIQGCFDFRSPTFSPDGRSVVFSFSKNGSSLSTLGRVNTDGSGFQELTPNGGYAYSAPSALPDGGAVVALANNGLGSSQVAYVPLNGGAIIYSLLGNEVLAVVNRVVASPSGAQVAFDGRGASGNTRVYVAELTAGRMGNPRRVTNFGSANAQETWPTWTRSDQVGFLFVDTSGGDPGIYRSTVALQPSNSVTLAVPSALEPSYGPL